MAVVRLRAQLTPGALDMRPCWTEDSPSRNGRDCAQSVAMLNRMCNGGLHPSQSTAPGVAARSRVIRAAFVAALAAAALGDRGAVWPLGMLMPAVGSGVPPLRQLDKPPVLSAPMFSLATLGPDNSTNMNIITYASPVGIRPNRVWCVSLYKGTRSYENFIVRRTGVLQLLRENHASLIYVLGGQSGRDVDKAASCASSGFPWRAGTLKGGERLLPGCSAYYRLTQEGDMFDAGDHQVAMCRIEEILEESLELESSSAGPPGVLYTAFARERGLVSDIGRAVPPQ